MRAIAVELDADCIADFEKEILLLRSLRARNIVLFYGMGHGDDGPFCVLEYMARGSVRGILDRHSPALHLAHRYSFAADAAKGMAFLHGLDPPMVHRDLKSGK